MKLWPVLTGIALSFTLIACKAPTPPKGVLILPSNSGHAAK